MSSRAKIIAVILSLVFCVGVLVFLRLFGASNRTVLAAPLVRQVNAPHEAFSVWRKNRVHGRVLVLIDRHLNADIDDRTDEFQENEFTRTTDLARLCDAVRADLKGTGVEDFSCDINGLNTQVLRRVSLYPLFLRKGQPDPAARIVTLAGYLALPDAFTVPIPRGSEDDLVRINRLILEHTYPDLCPKRPDYHILPVNYVHQAIRAGIVRKVYHLVSEDAWETVSSALRGNARVESSDGSFRITIAEGVSVRIMRLRDLPALDEPVLVNLNTDSISDDERRALRALFSGKLRSDLVVVSGIRSSEFVAGERKTDGTNQ